MFSLGSEQRYFLYTGNCDIRKSFDGLSGMVEQHFKMAPTSGNVFVFINRRRTHMKLLHWEYGGFVLYYKRLEKGTFSIPSSQATGAISWPSLVLMVQGILVDKYRIKTRFHLEKIA